MKLLSSKIFFGFLLVIIGLAGPIIYYSYQQIESHYHDTLKTDLVNLDLSIQNQIIPYLRTNNQLGLDSLVKSLGSKIETRITVMDAIGKVLADSEHDPSQMENHSTRPEIQIALKDSVGSSTRYSTTVQENMLYVALPIKDGNKIVGVSRVSLFISRIDELLTQLTSNILEVVLIVVILTILGVLILSRSLTRPINKLSQASQKVGEGDFDVKVYINGRDEIKGLADNFNFMTGKIKELFEKVTSQKEELNKLIRSIEEGLLVVDIKGRVLLHNQSFSEIIDKEDCIDKYYWDVVDSIAFGELLRSVFENKKRDSQEININNRHFLISSNYIESKDEVVMLFHDITKSKELDQMKKDFVVNVSHELRTPLTAIKGFVETLEEELDGDNRYYLGIVHRHTNRLINIVQDLMHLSEMENINTELVISSVDMSELVENVIKIYEYKIADKHLKLAINISDGMPQVNIDRFKIEQVFVNLIDNAIKYTDTGQVSVDIYREKSHAIFEIKDTGVGIPEKDIERIFERFYCVDKSRSRKLGGTGLGLSIVKHIILLHKGDINIQSKVNEGTQFRIKIPI